jgi:inner membrane protein
MNGNCHFIFAAASAAAIAMNLEMMSTAIASVSDMIGMEGIGIDASPSGVTLIIMGALIGGIFPDIDNPDSSMGHLSKPLSTVIGSISVLTGKTGMKHRGIFHDFAIYVMGFILSFFLFQPLMGFFIGALSHLFLDAMNPAGVPVLFGIKTLRFAKVKSGSKEAVFLTWLLVVLVLLIGIVCRYFLPFANIS